MSTAEIIPFPKPETRDGGKARILKRREKLWSDRFHPTSLSLRERISYDAETGIIRWRPKPGNDSATKAWNGRFAGKIGGTDHDGYIYISFDHRTYAAHRVIWAYMFGEWPEVEIDHIDRNPSNNRIANLRLATHEQNIANSKLRSANTSGFRGVTFIHPNNRWRPELRWAATIRLNGKAKNLGHFSTKEEAAAKFDATARAHYGEFYNPSDLAMDHADPEDNGLPNDVAYCAPDSDLA